MSNLGNNRLLQFWSAQIWLSLFSLFLSIILILELNRFLVNIPRDFLPFIATIFSTLLGLTFTSFAIVSAFMPTLGQNYLRTQTFDNIGSTFIFTLLFQLAALIISLFTYLLYQTSGRIVLFDTVIFAMVLSLSFLVLLIRYMFQLFKITRNRIT